MKYLIRLKKEDNSFVDMQTVDEEYIYKHKEVEELPYKEGFFVTYEYDKEQDKVIGKYVEIPKSEVELLKEKIETNSKALEDLLLSQLGEV